jgi:hypothetical protein
LSGFDKIAAYPNYKISIKYDCEGFEERNNFLHRNFFRFEMKF